jgi:hypothetical protein
MIIRGLLATAALVAASLLHHPAGSLALTRGVYVEADMPCRGAPMSARSWFGGGYEIQASHAHCDARTVVRKGTGRYVVVGACRAVGGAASYRVVDHITVISPTEFKLENEFGSFHARWCRD